MCHCFFKIFYFGFLSTLKKTCHLLVPRLIDEHGWMSTSTLKKIKNVLQCVFLVFHPFSQFPYPYLGAYFSIRNPLPYMLLYLCSIQCYTPVKIIGIKINCSIKSEKSLRLLVHISKTLIKIEGTPIQSWSQILRLVLQNNVKILR